MEPLDLHTLSINNIEGLKKSYDTVKTPILEEFASHIRKEGTVSINRPIKKTLDSFINEKILNVHQKIHFENPNLNEAERDELFKTEQPDYYGKRTAIDNSFIDGKLFKYGALNIGNLGAYNDFYGNLCIALKKSELENYYLVYVKNDSLRFYVDDKNNVITNEIIKDVSSQEFSNLLASIKHSNDISSSNKSNWCDILCSNLNYVEAIIKDDIKLEHILEIRIKKEDYEKYLNLALKLLTNNISDVEKAEAAFFSHLRTLMYKNNIDFNQI